MEGNKIKKGVIYTNAGVSLRGNTEQLPPPRKKCTFSAYSQLQNTCAHETPTHEILEYVR